MIHPPVFVIEDGDVYTEFPKLDLSIRLEPQDIEYPLKAYDASGSLLDLYVAKRTHRARFLGFPFEKQYLAVFVRNHGPPTKDPQALRRALSEFLAATRKFPPAEGGWRDVALDRLVLEMTRKLPRSYYKRHFS